MTILSEGRHAAEFILSEGPGHVCREALTVLSGEGKLAAGTVIGKTEASGTATVSAKSGNTGSSGTLTMDGSTPLLGGVKQGRYSVICIEPASNAGVFEVTDPDGIMIGTIVAGAAAAVVGNHLKFGISDATDFVSGDGFFVDVTALTFKWRSADPTNTDGSSVAGGILYDAVDATSADVTGVGFVRGPAEVNGNCLTYDANVDDATKKAIKVAELGKRGIIVR